MVQNRNKLIDLFIGNISNSIIHKILEKAIGDELISNKYNREIQTSWEIAKNYRNKINPATAHLPEKDAEGIRKRIVSRVRSELSVRMSKGYENIDFSSIENFVDDALKDMKVC